MVATGSLAPASLVWRAGMPAWVPVAAVPELRAPPPLPAAPPSERTDTAAPKVDEPPGHAQGSGSTFQVGAVLGPYVLDRFVGPSRGKTEVPTSCGDSVNVVLRRASDGATGPAILESVCRRVDGGPAEMQTEVQIDESELELPQRVTEAGPEGVISTSRVKIDDASEAPEPRPQRASEAVKNQPVAGAGQLLFTPLAGIQLLPAPEGAGLDRYARPTLGARLSFADDFGLWGLVVVSPYLPQSYSEPLAEGATLTGSLFDGDVVLMAGGRFLDAWSAGGGILYGWLDGKGHAENDLLVMDSHCSGGRLGVVATAAYEALARDGLFFHVGAYVGAGSAGVGCEMTVDVIDPSLTPEEQAQLESSLFPTGANSQSGGASSMFIAVGLSLYGGWTLGI